MKEETTKGSFGSTSIITIEDDQPNKGMDFVMDSREIRTSKKDVREG